MQRELKNPMTPQGFERLSAEHHQLLNVTRPKVVQGIADAAAEGDRSENAEYIYGRKRLREIDKRLAYLTSIMADVELIDPQDVGGDQVFFGAAVTVKDEQGKLKTWQIVGMGEADVSAQTISWRSPVAKALWGKRIGDLVVVELPQGDLEYTVVGISFGKRQVA